MKNILIFLILFLSSTFAGAVNVQQFTRSNSLTFEMIEDARLSSSHVINHYEWLFNLGLSYVDQPLTIKNSDNSQQIDSVVDDMASVHLGAAYYIKPYWQIAINTSFSMFDNNLGKSISEFQDIDVRTKVRLYNGRRSAFTLMPIAYIPLGGGKTGIMDNASPPKSYGTDELLSDSGFGLGLFAIYEYLFKHFQVSFNLGYRFNDKAKFIDNAGKTQIDKSQVLTTGIGLYYPFHKKVGLNIEFISNFTAPFFNDDINPTELYAGLSTGLADNIHAFAGAGFGNIFSNDDGNDYRVVAGLKFTPGTKPVKSYVEEEKQDIKPNRIIEDSKTFCKKAYLFNGTNAVTLLFANDSAVITQARKEKLNKVIDLYKSRKDDIERIEVYGHASKVGSENYNMVLGEKRANAIKRVFAENNIEPEMTSIVSSKGDGIPLEEGDSESNHRLNRRVEISFVMNEKYRSCYE